MNIEQEIEWKKENKDINLGIEGKFEAFGVAFSVMSVGLYILQDHKQEFLQNSYWKLQIDCMSLWKDYSQRCLSQDFIISQGQFLLK